MYTILIARGEQTKWGLIFLKGKKREPMKAKWIKIGDTKKDLFDVLNYFKQGLSIEEIPIIDRSISVVEICNLFDRTKEYLKSHLILDSYLETVNKLSQIELTAFELEWSSNEIRELVNLHISGASPTNIALLMRKSESEIRNKLQSLSLIHERN